MILDFTSGAYSHEMTDRRTVSGSSETLAVAGRESRRPEGLVAVKPVTYMAGLKPAPTAMARTASAPRE